MVMIEPSQFITDYRGFAIVTTVIFAVLGPLSLLTGVPAVFAAFRVSCHARLLDFCSLVPKHINFKCASLKSWEEGPGNKARFIF